MIVDTAIVPQYSGGYRALIVRAPSKRSRKSKFKEDRCPFQLREEAEDWIEAAKAEEARKLKRIPLGKWQRSVLKFLYQVGPMDPIGYLKGTLRKERGEKYRESLQSMQKRGLIEQMDLGFAFRRFDPPWKITEEGKAYWEKLELARLAKEEEDHKQILENCFDIF